MPRGLSQQFMDDLGHGFLAPLRQRVRRDGSLCMELREDYLNVYYRGGSLLRLTRTPIGYAARFDEKYFAPGSVRPVDLPDAVRDFCDVDAWLTGLPHLKDAMDVHPKLGAERQAQQLVVADNNTGIAARSTDYFVCDIEYASGFGRFDLVAVHWPSRPATRKRQDGRRLVVAELKYADGALEGAAGLHAHVRDVNACLGDPGKLAGLKDEMVRVFNQKRELGLVDCGLPLVGFSDEKPLLLLVLANHDPDKSAMARLLATLPPSPHADVRVASASWMGYGLYDPKLRTVTEALAEMGAVA